MFFICLSLCYIQFSACFLSFIPRVSILLACLLVSLQLAFPRLCHNDRQPLLSVALAPSFQGNVASGFGAQSIHSVS